MKTFDTPEPISVSIELAVGDVRIAASERTDTVVEVRPSNPEKKADVDAAEATQVEYLGGRLLIKAPKGWKQYTWRGGGESITVRVELPADSRVNVDAGVSAIRCTGRLGECTFKTGAGDIRLEAAGAVRLKAGAGDIAIDRALGDAELTTGTGAIEVASIGGSAVIKNSAGNTWIGDVTGELHAKAAFGTIAVGRALASAAAKTATGDIRFGAVSRGEVVAETGFGNVEIGVAEGSAAWLDLKTSFGNVRNELEAAGPPASGEEAVEVRARTGYGDISIVRGAAGPTSGGAS